jgi:hypothetical protein
MPHYPAHAYYPHPWRSQRTFATNATDASTFPLDDLAYIIFVVTM